MKLKGVSKKQTVMAEVTEINSLAERKDRGPEQLDPIETKDLGYNNTQDLSEKDSPCMEPDQETRPQIVQLHPVVTHKRDR